MCIDYAFISNSITSVTKKLREFWSNIGKNVRTDSDDKCSSLALTYLFQIRKSDTLYNPIF